MAKDNGQASKTAKWQKTMVKLAKQQNNIKFRSNDQINTTAFILTFYPISVQNYLQKQTSKFRFASPKIFFSGKKCDF